MTISSVPTLTGYVRHRLKLYFAPRNSELLDESYDNSKGAGFKRKVKVDLSVDKEIIDGQICNSGEQETVGFFFDERNEHENDNGNDATCTTRITASQSMLKTLCDASRFNLKVEIHSYSVRYLNDNDKTKAKVIELHLNGLNFYNDILESARESDSDTSAFQIQKGGANFKSLSQIQEVEQKMKSVRSIEKKQSNGKGSTKYFDIVGKVDAISPIIAVDPSDPFALIEIYDADAPAISAVIILRGENALCCHPAIAPGHILSFTKIKRSKWHIPKNFKKSNIPRRLHHRAPSHIFVVEDATSFHWGQCNDIPQQKISISCTPKISFELPTTISSLHSIQGRVTFVNYSKFKKIDKSTSEVTTTNVIHHVIIERHNKQGADRICKIYLLHFPQSPDLYFNLNVGSIVCAMNVHLIQKANKLENIKSNLVVPYIHDSYGACLRSTVTVIALVSDKYLIQEYDDHFGEYNRKRANFMSSCRNALPQSPSCRQFYIFHNIKTSYADYEWIATTRLTSFQKLKCMDTVNCVLELFLSAIGKNCFNEQQRDPYKEWFDHACDRNCSKSEDTTEVSSCCFLNNCRSYPTVENVFQIRNSCIERMYEHLSKHPKVIGSAQVLDNGWTTSIVLDADKFRKTGGSKENRGIFIGGIVTQCSHNRQVPCQMEDEVCQVPIIPIFDCHDQTEHTNRAKVGDFCIIQLRYAVISCFYIGKTSHISNEDCALKTVPLLPLDSSNREIKVGPCQITSINGHCFLLGIQFHYLLQSGVYISQSTYPVLSEAIVDSRAILPITKFIHHIQNPLHSSIQLNCKFLARFVRLYWNKRKIRNNCHEGFNMISSYLPTKQTIKDGLLNIQNIRVKLKIILNPLSSIELNNKLTTLPKLPSHHIHTASAWRQLAENHQYCLLTHNEPSENFQSCNIEVSLGKEALIHAQHDSYCTMNMITLRVRQACSKNYQMPSLNNEKIRRYLPGDLMPSAYRLKIAHGVDGELRLPIHSFNGVPTMTISSLNHRLVQDKIFYQSSSGLVFRIQNVQIAAVRFCSVRIQCTKCFKFLTKDKKSFSQENGGAIGENHFWNEPLRNNRPQRPIVQNDSGTKWNNPALICPSGCTKNFAEPKWELSSFIDDGTGLAKVYAERGVAIALFGSGIDVDLIEEAAGYSEIGVMFQNDKPTVSRKHLNKLRRNTVKQKLSIQERASIELNYHAKHLQRKVDVICRVKYPTKENNSLNHSDISTIIALGRAGRVISSRSETNAFPLLELKLEDCSQCVDSTSQTGWSILKSL